LGLTTEGGYYYYWDLGGKQQPVLAQFIESLVEGQAVAAEAKAAKEEADDGVGVVHGAAVRAPAADADDGGVRLFTSEQLASERMPEETVVELPSDANRGDDRAAAADGARDGATDGVVDMAAAAEAAAVAVESDDGNVNGNGNGGGDAAAVPNEVIDTSQEPTVAATSEERGEHDEGAQAQPEEAEPAAVAAAAAGAVEEENGVVRERRRGGMREAESERVEAALGILRGGLMEPAASRNGRRRSST
jgi:hypothetical protein